MHRIIHLWLEPTPAQIVALQQTMDAVNAARNQISAVAWQHGMFTARALFEVGAEDIGLNAGLSLVMARRSIATPCGLMRASRVLFSGP